MHTIKGESASFHVQELKERVHQFEERLIPFREQKSSPQLENLWGSIREELPEIRKILEKFCQDHRKIIGDVSSKAANSERPVSVNSIEKIAGCLAKVLPSDSKEYQMFYEELVLQPVEQFFAHFEAAVMDLAERQKKDVEFQIIPPSTPIRVRMNAYEGILGGMIHAFTNAVDHGIEIPKDRESKGKKPRGRIEVSFEKQGNRLKIQVKDDGRGINPDIIGRVAVEKGVITSEKLSSMSADQIIQLVFAPGFSSKTEVTEVSGRGVGLDVVQVEAGKLSGKAWVESELGQGSRVIIEVPVIQ